MTDAILTREGNRSASDAQEKRPSFPVDSDDASSNAGSASALRASKNDEKQPAPASKWKKTKSHFKKHWKSYTLGVVIGLTIFLPILFKVLIPLIIQRVINSRDIHVEHASVYIRNSNEIEFSANASVNSPMAAKVRELEFTLHDTRVDNTQPVLTSDIDGFPVQKSTKLEIVDKTLRINDPDALVDWALRFINSDKINFDVQVKDIGIYLGHLQYDAHLRRPITINGLQGLEDLNLDTLKLTLPPLDGKNVRANISFSNPSSLSVAVGNATVDLVLSGIKVGEAMAYDIQLVPGRTQVYIDALVNVQTILSNLGLVIREQMQALQAGHAILELQVTSFTMKDQKIEFLGALLKKKPLKLRVPLVTLLDGAATGVLKAGIGAMNGTEMASQNVLDAIGDVFSNKTLLNRIHGHWEKRKYSQRSPFT